MLDKLPLVAVAAGIASLLAVAQPATAAEHTVKMLNRSAAGTMVFEPAYLKVAPGDSVTFEVTDKTHNAEIIKGMLPEGASPFKGKINEEITVRFEEEGVYGYKCAPHYAMGMVGVIVVGDPTVNVAEAKTARHPGKASRIMADLLVQAETNLAAAQ